MKLTITKQSLSAALSIIKPAVASRNTIDILNNVLLRASDSLTLTGSDNTISIKTSAVATVDAHGETTVNFQKLSQIVNSLDGDIDIYLENNFLIIKQGRSRFKLHTLPASDFPDLPDISENTANIQAKEFSAAVSAISHAASKNDALPIVTGINVSDQGFIATDGRAMVSVYQASISAPNITLPVRAAQIVGNFSSDIIVANINKNVVNFDIDGTLIKSRLIDGQYPNVTNIVEQELPETISCDLSAIVSAVRSVSVIASDAYRKVTLISNGDVLTVSSGHTGEEASIDVACAASCDMDKSFDANYLLSVLGACVSDELCIEFGADDKPIRIVDGSVTHVLAHVN